MPRRGGSQGVYDQPGRRAGSIARKNRTKKGGRYGEKIGIPKGGKRRGS